VDVGATARQGVDVFVSDVINFLVARSELPRQSTAASSMALRRGLRRGPLLSVRENTTTSGRPDVREIVERISACSTAIRNAPAWRSVVRRDAIADAAA